VALLTLSMLLIPATCASAAGPHSIFVDPQAHEAHLQHHQHLADTDEAMDIATMSEEQILLLLAFGHLEPEATSLDRTDDPCDSAPRLRDMPSTMAMAALSMPAITEELAPVDLPMAISPEPGSVFLITGISMLPESPPPQG
jgi:hypothetical protein